jgi:hypothetical protein
MMHKKPLRRFFIALVFCVGRAVIEAHPVAAGPQRTYCTRGNGP